MSLGEATLVYAFQPTVPTGYSASAPYVTDLTFNPAEVLAISWKVPPGPRGVMGWALGVSGQQIVPTNVGEWIASDDEEQTWALEETVQTGDFTFIAYNTGTFAHQVFIRFLCVPLRPTATLEPWLVQPIPNSELNLPESSSILVHTRSMDEAILTEHAGVRP